MTAAPASEQLARRVWALFTPYRVSLTAIVLAVLLSSGLGIITPFLTQATFDKALFPPDGVVRLNLLTWLVVGMIAALQIFEPIFVLYRDNQPIVSSTITMVYYLWQKTFSHFEIGYGSAISWIILVIIMIVTIIQFYFQDRWVTYDVY